MSREEIPLRLKEEMFALLAGHFNGVSRTEFERDLAEKNHVILLQQGLRLVGFSTLLAYKTSFEGEPLSVIYSGDTIVAPEAWGTPALFQAWIETVTQLRASFPHGKFYWLLLTSGFRTYRFLPVFWREFWPRFDMRPSTGHQRLIDHLATERFGDQYDSTSGIVRFRQPQRLRADLAEVPSGRTTEPHIAYFLRRNPNHANGDELVCLAELDKENLTRAGRRMLRTPCHEPQTCAC